MSKSIRGKLGKEQYELIKFRNSLREFLDCSIGYGTIDENEVAKIQEVIEELKNEIQTLNLLRKALKEE